MGPVLKGLIKLQSVENLLRAEKAKLTRCRRNVIIQENSQKGGSPAQQGAIRPPGT